MTLSSVTRQLYRQFLLCLWCQIFNTRLTQSRGIPQCKGCLKCLHLPLHVLRILSPLLKPLWFTRSFTLPHHFFSFSSELATSRNLFFVFFLISLTIRSSPSLPTVCLERISVTPKLLGYLKFLNKLGQGERHVAFMFKYFIPPFEHDGKKRKTCNDPAGFMQSDALCRERGGLIEGPHFRFS